jgi:hypothetical protein
MTQMGLRTNGDTGWSRRLFCKDAQKAAEKSCCGWCKSCSELIKREAVQRAAKHSPTHIKSQIIPSQSRHPNSNTRFTTTLEQFPTEVIAPVHNAAIDQNNKVNFGIALQ